MEAVVPGAATRRRHSQGQPLPADIDFLSEIVVANDRLSGVV